MHLEKYQGSMLGLALADAMGAPYEGGPLERFAWRLIGKTRDGKMRWTDDTQMSLDLAESLISFPELNPDDLAQRFAASYQWSRGYGPGAARLLKKIAKGTPWQEANRLVFSNGSFGNGGAMRAPVIGLFYKNRIDEISMAAKQSALITHAHDLGQEGAVAIAQATAAVLKGAEWQEVFESVTHACESSQFHPRIEIAKHWLTSSHVPTAREVARQLGNGVAAIESCVTAIYIGCRFLKRPFLEMTDFSRELRGDVDSISSMSGAIWGAARGIGELPANYLEQLEAKEKIMDVASMLFAKSK